MDKNFLVTCYAMLCYECTEDCNSYFFGASSTCEKHRMIGLNPNGMLPTVPSYRFFFTSKDIFSFNFYTHKDHQIRLYTIPYHTIRYETKACVISAPG